jgi:hypothetical protein
VVSLEKKKGADESGKIGDSIPTYSSGAQMGKGIGKLPQKRIQIVNPII